MNPCTPNARPSSSVDVSLCYGSPGSAARSLSCLQGSIGLISALRRAERRRKGTISACGDSCWMGGGVLDNVHKKGCEMGC